MPRPLALFCTISCVYGDDSPKIITRTLLLYFPLEQTSNKLHPLFIKNRKGPTSPCVPDTSILLLAGLKVRMCSSRKSSRKAIALFFILCRSPIFVTDKHLPYQEDPSQY